MANLYSLNKQEGETHFNLKTLVTHRQQYEEKKVCRLSTSEAQRKWPQQWLRGKVTLLHAYLPDTVAINSSVANPKLIKAWTKVWVLAWINNMHTVTSAFAVWRKELNKWSISERVEMKQRQRAYWFMYNFQLVTFLERAHKQQTS